MTLRWIGSPATVGDLTNALVGALLDGMVREDTPVTYISISLKGDEMTANVYVDIAGKGGPNA